MASQLTQLEEELDDLLVQYLATLDTYQTFKQKLASELKNGYFELARAKLALGATRLSPSNYDLSEHPSRFLIDIETTAAKPETKQNDLNAEQLSPVLTFTQRLRILEIEEDLIDIEKKNSKSEESGLRKRLPNSAIIPSTESTVPSPSSPTKSTVAETESTIPKSTSPPDPILQFSAFPPPSLRASQKLFSSAITTSLTVAEIQLTLRRIKIIVEDCRNRINSH